MLKKLRKEGRRVIALALSLLTAVSLAAAPVKKVSAADGTVNYNSGPAINYGSYLTTRMTFDSQNTAYCLEPALRTPDSGSYQYNLLDQNYLWERRLII